MNPPQLDEGRFQSYILEPGAPSAFACFGTWEGMKTCVRIEKADDPLDGCSQAAECRRYTLEQNPPTTRFTIKPRRDGRFEIQQFRDFIRDQVSYHMEITPGMIAITYPGKRAVPKSKRFFLHVKHLEEAGLPVDIEFELVMSLEKMVLREAGELVANAVRIVRPVEEDPDARRKRIAEKLRKKASESARSKDDDHDDDDLDIDIDIDIDDDDDDEEIEASEVEVEIEAADTSDADDADDQDGDDDDDTAGLDDDEVMVSVDGAGSKDSADDDDDDDDGDEDEDED
ncbi:MAG: hypothetical protein ACI9MR_002449 [Myxococcota bacterium]|jgi:hypothetical protein